MDYKQFRSQFDFIFLSGLKGQERVCEIQDKNTNKMYDYKEVIKENEDIEKQKQRCQDLMNLNHPNILKLLTYSYCFIEENHGFPYCKFFLVFEYCESSLDREIQTLLKKKKFMKTPRLSKIFSALISTLQYLHGQQIFHGELIPEFICLTEKDEYKLTPQIQVKSQKNQLAKYQQSLKDIYKIKPNIHQKTKITLNEYSKKHKPKLVSSENSKASNDLNFSKSYCSPEVYINEKNRVAYKRLVIDPYVSEVFSLGMMFLSVGILENLEGFYKTFTVDQDFLIEKLLKFESLHGKKLTSILNQLLKVDPEERCRLDVAMDYLKSEDEAFHSLNLVSSESKGSAASFKKNMKKIVKQQTFSADYEDNTENSLIQKLFNQLPQEYQDEIDKKISEQMRIIEDEKLPTEMHETGNRYQGQKEDNICHGWGIYWWANGERYEG